MYYLSTDFILASLFSVGLRICHRIHLSTGELRGALCLSPGDRMIPLSVCHGDPYFTVCGTFNERSSNVLYFKT